MAQETHNPFVLPGFGQAGEAGSNPLFAGLDMMRQAWQSMAGADHPDTSAVPPLSIEDLDKRIRELQIVQNWLQLNASMLSNTIRGMEIQRSTLATLKSFAGQGAAGHSAAAPADEASQAGQAYAQAAEDWWKMLQTQFEELTSAATTGLQGAAGAPEAAAEAPAARKKSATAGARAKAKSGGGKATKKSAARKTGARARRDG